MTPPTGASIDYVLMGPSSDIFSDSRSVAIVSIALFILVCFRVDLKEQSPAHCIFFIDFQLSEWTVEIKHYILQT